MTFPAKTIFDRCQPPNTRHLHPRSFFSQAIAHIDQESRHPLTRTNHLFVRAYPTPTLPSIASTTASLPVSSKMLSHQQSLADDRLAMMQNENVLTTTKTPAAAAGTSRQTRRALGDISNRKKDGPSATYKPSSFVATKTRAVVKEVPRTSTKQVVALDDQVRGETKPTATKKQLKSAVAPPKSSLEGQLTTKSTMVFRKAVEIDFSEDIERPAGRTWKQQQALDDDDDFSLPSMEGAWDARERFMAMLDRRHQNRLLADEEEEKEYEQAIDDEIARLAEEDCKSCPSTCMPGLPNAQYTHRDFVAVKFDLTPSDDLLVHELVSLDLELDEDYESFMATQRQSLNISF